MIEHEPGGLAAAVEIERHYPPEKWAERIKLIENTEHREVAREYLRAMYQRVMTIRKYRRKHEGQQTELF